MVECGNCRLSVLGGEGGGSQETVVVIEYLKQGGGIRETLFDMLPGQINDNDPPDFVHVLLTQAG